MDTNIKRIDTRQEAIKAMAWALRDCGYTRDSDPSEVKPEHLSVAATEMIMKLIQMRDVGFLREFDSEQDDNMVCARWRQVATSKRTGDQGSVTSLMALESVACDDYAKGFIPEALDLLDSADEISRDRWVDEQIDQRKAMT